MNTRRMFVKKAAAGLFATGASSLTFSEYEMKAMPETKMAGANLPNTGKETKMLGFERDKTALVIVDMQNDFVREGAAMEVPDARKTIRPIQSLLKMARQYKMPVIYTKFVAGPKCTFLWEWSPQIPNENCCIRGFKRKYKDMPDEIECTDIVEELYPQPQDYVFEKYNYSAFRNAPLKDILIANHCVALIVVGTVTHICVCDTVHDAAQEHFKVLVASDGVSSYSDLQQKAALESFHTKYGMVETSDEIIKRFQ